MQSGDISWMIILFMLVILWRSVLLVVEIRVHWMKICFVFSKILSQCISEAYRTSLQNINKYLPPLFLKWSVSFHINGILKYQVCQRLVESLWFSPGTPVSSINKTDCHDIAEILLKVALIMITPNSSCICHTTMKLQY
jgi:hypothetical protein